MLCALWPSKPAIIPGRDQPDRADQPDRMVVRVDGVVTEMGLGSGV